MIPQTHNKLLNFLTQQQTRNCLERFEKTGVSNPLYFLGTLITDAEKSYGSIQHGVYEHAPYGKLQEVGAERALRKPTPLSLLLREITHQHLGV